MNKDRKQVSNTMSETTSNQGKVRSLTVVIIIMALLLAIVGWNWFSMRSEVKDLAQMKEDQRVEMQKQLDSLIAEHNLVKVEAGKLADSLRMKDSIILANATEIKKLLDTKYEYGKVKKKLDRLRVITQSYLHQMDSLYTLNRQLQAENAQMKEEIRTEQKKSQQLNKDKQELSDKINTGSALSAYEISASGVRQRGSKGEEATEKSRRIDKVRVSFIIGENKLTSPGTKTVYVRIADPKGAVLAKGKGDDYSFAFQGQKLQYSIAEQINYQNSALPVTCYWSKLPLQDDLEEGTYQVAIYLENRLIGETKFKVRKTIF